MEIENYDPSYNPLMYDLNFQAYSKIMRALGEILSDIPSSLLGKDIPEYFVGKHLLKDRLEMLKQAALIPKHFRNPALVRVISDLEKSVEINDEVVQKMLRI